jgi:hypothetical protein
MYRCATGSCVRPAIWQASPLSCVILLVHLIWLWSFIKFRYVILFTIPPSLSLFLSRALYIYIFVIVLLNQWSPCCTLIPAPCVPEPQTQPQTKPAPDCRTNPPEVLSIKHSLELVPYLQAPFIHTVLYVCMYSFAICFFSCSYVSTIVFLCFNNEAPEINILYFTLLYFLYPGFTCCAH